MVQEYFATKGKHCIPYMKHVYSTLFIIKILIIWTQLFKYSTFLKEVLYYVPHHIFCITVIHVLLCISLLSKQTRFLVANKNFGHRSYFSMQTAADDYSLSYRNFLYILPYTVCTKLPYCHPLAKYVVLFTYQILLKCELLTYYLFSFTTSILLLFICIYKNVQFILLWIVVLIPCRFNINKYYTN